MQAPLTRANLRNVSVCKKYKKDEYSHNISSINAPPSNLLEWF
jgi:hypothetical protein